MEIPHSTFKIDINNINAPLIRLIESVNDKSVRYVDVELYCNSMLIALSDSCTAKAAFVTDGILVNDNVNCSLNEEKTAIIVPIDKSVIENSRSGLMSVEVTVTDGEQNLTLPFAFKVKVKDSIVNTAGINNSSVGTIADIVKEIAAARGSFQNLNDRFNNNEQDIAKKENLSNKVSTVDFQNPSESNYPSITALYDYHNNYVAPCYEDIENLGNDKADKAATLAGYGIEDAYTKSYLDKKFNSKLDNRGFDTEPQSNSPNLMTSGNIYNALLNKYDFSNIETGSGALTVATQGAIDSGLIKSCTFRYQKTGNTANIFFSVVFNEGSISYLQFTGLPFIAKNESDQNRHITATNKQTQVIVYPVGSWLTLNFGSTKTFLQDETLNGVITMLVS